MQGIISASAPSVQKALARKQRRGRSRKANQGAGNGQRRQGIPADDGGHTYRVHPFPGISRFYRVGRRVALYSSSQPCGALSYPPRYPLHSSTGIRHSAHSGPTLEASELPPPDGRFFLEICCPSSACHRAAPSRRRGTAAAAHDSTKSEMDSEPSGLFGSVCWSRFPFSTIYLSNGGWGFEGKFAVRLAWLAPSTLD